MYILLIAHSLLRWLILLVAVIAIVKYLVGWLAKSQFKGMDSGLMAGFSGLMDLEATLGIIFLLWNGFSGIGFPAFRILHGLTMIVAAIVAHLSARWKNADDLTRFRNNFFIVLAALILIFIGISLLSVARQPIQ
jgi:hypothetical protein